MARRAFAGGTHRVEAGQNFPDIADIRYGDWRLYPRIVEANAAAFARRPPHRDDRWEHPITAPVLFAGDSVWGPPY
ncbi:MAG: hypothetical protein FWG66_00075, partial [Spirochaetes bacterium]|nr:hypothetical protein [Spirochaetota bacterium]